jgi:hypothetical protein
MTPGKAVPAKTAHIEIGGQKLEKEIPEGASSVTFDVTLEKGPAELHDPLSARMAKSPGAFFAYVKKK